MPRVAEDRPPAQPVSAEQKERYRRILRAAARHGADKGLERVQMHDVARDAGVAIATLYRYFPSKMHLFTALMNDLVQQMRTQPIERKEGESAEEAVSRLLRQAGADLLEHPHLAHAMVQSNNATLAQASGQGVDNVFEELLLHAAGIEEPTPHDVRIMLLIEQAWYGLIMAALNKWIDADRFAADTDLMVRLLMRGRDEDPARQ